MELAAGFALQEPTDANGHLPSEYVRNYISRQTGGRLLYRGSSETEARVVLDRTPGSMLVGTLYG